MLDPACTAEQKCWEHYQPESRVMEADIQAALAAARMAAQISNPSLEELWQISGMFRDVATLRSRQWREMVREPFAAFDLARKPNTSKGMVCRVKSLTLDDIMGDL